jgi:GNAT superfamily N-acetyltransferase
VTVALRDSDGRLIAGLIGRTHALAFWLEISVVWVDAAYRRHGLGRRLMEAAEQEARQRGCRFARTATSDFQAPGFYVKLGYVPYGRLEDCPPGEMVFYLRKVL